jgi:tRNA (guanosine-2'-O-)-methyltransferase
MIPRRVALALTALVPLAGCQPVFAGSGPASAGAARTGDSPDPLAAGYPTPEPVRPGPPASAPEAPRIRSLDPCVPSNVEVCFNALDDNCNGAIDEGCGTPGGVVQFMIAWDSARADVDLNVTDPSGELIEAGRISQSGLIKGRDCPGRRQECGGVNVENVFLEGSKAPTRGTYRLAISLEKLNGDEPPIWVTLSSRLGAKHSAYEIRLNEAEDEQRLELSL